MQRLMTQGIAFLLFLISFASSSDATPLRLASVNEIATDEQGWMSPASGDPYLVFDAENRQLSELRFLKITTQGKNVLNRHLYTELFWATDTHGFDEAKKGFYIQAFSKTAETKIVTYLNFGEFLSVMKENGKTISVIRLDLDQKGLSNDFSFKCEMELVESLPPDLKDANNLPIHPPYLSRHIMDMDIFKYSTKHIVKDFLYKLRRDPVFVILYACSLMLVISALIYTFRFPKRSQIDRP